MINELFGQAIVDLFVGFLMGIINAWNKKVMFILLIIAIIFVIIGSFYVGIDNIYTESWPWWRTLYGIVWVVLGMFAGKAAYEENLK